MSRVFKCELFFTNKQRNLKNKMGLFKYRKWFFQTIGEVGPLSDGGGGAEPSQALDKSHSAAASYLMLPCPSPHCLVAFLSPQLFISFLSSFPFPFSFFLYSHFLFLSYFIFSSLYNLFPFSLFHRNELQLCFHGQC